jgi:uncharacterized protein YbjT (DUF2867 family)
MLITDLTQPSECIYVLDGVTAVYHIGPPFHPKEAGIGFNMIDAALHHSKDSKNGEVGIEHFVHSSVLHSLLRKLINHGCKRYLEEYLIESGLAYTILQPMHFYGYCSYPYADAEEG